MRSVGRCGREGRALQPGGEPLPHSRTGAHTHTHTLRYLKGASEGRQRVLVVLRQGGEEKRRRAALEE